MVASETASASTADHGAAAATRSLKVSKNPILVGFRLD